MDFEPDVRRDAKRLAHQSGFLLGATLRVLGAHAIRAPFGREASDAEWARYDRSIHRAGEALIDLTNSTVTEVADAAISYGQRLPRELPPPSRPRWMFWRR